MLDLQQIHEISVGVDEHLRKLEGFAALLRDIKASLDELRHAQERAYLYELGKVRRELGEVAGQLRKYGLQEVSGYEREVAEIRGLLEADWPAAVDPALVCDSDAKAQVRAEAILHLLVGEHLKGKRFLDFGCGAGHVVAEAFRQEAGLALGYDIDPAKFEPSAALTADFEAVRRAAPFDVVLLHDVLDHVVALDPVAALAQVRSLLAPGGRVYVRNHPWSSRHGGHLYLQRNKAFLHLVLDEVELARLGGLACEHNVRVVTPLDTYRHWVREAGFQVRAEYPLRTPVEEFFTRPSVVQERLRRHWPDPAAMVNHLEIDFVEYVLVPAHSGQQVL